MSASAHACRFGTLFAVLAAGVPSAALASEAEPPAAPTAPVKDGELIYSRDVNHTIGARYFPRQAYAATTAPTQAIVSSIAIGLAPLSDSENAAVTGSMRQFAAATAQIETQLLGPAALAPGTDTLAPAQSAAGSGSGVISQAMGALSGALGSLSALTGGRP
jgi:hypothetical protein